MRAFNTSPIITELQKKEIQQLSPISRYRLRKLLSQYLSAAPLIHHSSATTATSLDTKPQLSALPERRSARHQHLETLISLYHELSETASKSEQTDTSDQLYAVQQQLFQALNLRWPLSAQLPMVAENTQFSRYAFYYDGAVREGLLYDGTLYGRVYQISSHQRGHACIVAWVLQEQKVPVIVTPSRDGYEFWVSLQSSSYAVLIKQDQVLLNWVKALYPILRRFRAQFPIEDPYGFPSHSEVYQMPAIA
ncbi:hypothetical protein [Alkalinema sp. FACHB-956]|uniref:hypothetical protein n=1 Tax=Alkalinema sp. FACHB-956 TaxID=2692768 RepID=UPI0016871E0A|nr:hypothetical protein [Alkalinema sp. FACHB-956]MBD2329751.1 hypothetical protein [Alkalinema sp. FACHB-956]